MKSKLKAFVGIIVSVVFVIAIFTGSKGGYRAVRSSEKITHRWQPLKNSSIDRKETLHDLKKQDV